MLSSALPQACCLRRVPLRRLVLTAALAVLVVGRVAAGEEPSFTKQVAPILEQHCLRCHGDKVHRGGLSLATATAALAGGESGRALVPGKPDESLLLKLVSGDDPKMPRKQPPLTTAQVTVLRRWIADGAQWPENVTLADRQDGGDVWWSLKPLARPALPAVKNSAWVRNPVDAFVLSRLEQQGLTPNPEADRRTLIRRLSYDLLGLPPAPEEIDAFLQDRAPDAYERLVDRLLASPRYGERWARYWLDVVHYGDTHGFDKDKLRPNAWPYRDYVIRAFNEDKPYARFVEEQVAGDVLYPGTRDGIVALGFLAAGPWDFVGQVELREDTLDKKITRNLDRDDMVTTTMNTFTGLTVQCARCHDHKFDPIAQEDYYSLQAVFAAVDRADRPYEPDLAVAQARAHLNKHEAELRAHKSALNARLHELAGDDLAKLDRRIEELSRVPKGGPRPEYGYHSGLAASADTVKWVQVDLGRPTPIEAVVCAGCHDDFNGIGDGFGFPIRYKIEIADDAEFRNAVTVADHTGADVHNPGVRPQSVAAGGRRARYVRMTATRLAFRANDYNFALAELSVLTPDGTNAALGAPVTALDTIEAPPRWGKKNLVDGYYPGAAVKEHLAELAQLNERRRALLERATPAGVRQEADTIERELQDTAARLAALPPPGLVYAAATQFPAEGSFTPTGGLPRPISLLRRGSEKDPVRAVAPGTVACVPGLPSRFAAGPGHTEGERRAALAHWITDERNPLTWRSIVNRVWQYHFGQGLVETTNDFGHMGALPSHPELLDWLALSFRDGGQSLKQLHRLLVTSATYRQSSADNRTAARVDAGNRLLWRMNRRRLEAEAVRDAVLAVSGQLDTSAMYGPGFRPFGFKDDHSPHYLYEQYDPDEPSSHRRSVYRFLVRSVPDPFMDTLDCADPSQRVEKRNESLTALQALALLNDRFMVRMAEHFADRVEKMGPDLPARLAAAYRLALGRSPDAEEMQVLSAYANKHGLANACRLILNTNEFCFVD